ncbi:hypothetical protein [Hansschlegelia plantiphila]|uniref:LicD family protein n=1 Tax=Hansschlegelia plantiphila TaxID=374655 RepID=A0A9W6IZ29_9HYPH|nr:hypothetical protein [Hansschlegelia plantiphila]GLK66738.1 hypothetical protein GCM10008179_03760 [Hansschlegelia plantiphila]
MSYASLISKFVSSSGRTQRRREQLKSAMRQGWEKESVRLAERGVRSAIGGDWFACRLAEIRLDLGDHAYVRKLAEGEGSLLKTQDGQGLLARALIMAGEFEAAEALILQLILKVQSPEPLRLLRMLPASESLLDKACAAFQRSERTPYRKAIQASHLVEVAVAAGVPERGFELTSQSLRWLDGAKPERVTYSESDRTDELDKALLDFHQLMEGVGEFFLISGTLLGVMRENKLLSYDKDIDVGVLEPSVIGRLREAVGSSFAFSPDISTNIDGLKVKHRNGVVIDVFIHHVEGDVVWHGGPAHAWENSKWWSDDATRYGRTTYRGREFLIPSAWEVYLTENYGDWKSPQKRYNASLQAPNRRIRDATLAKLYSRQNFVKWHHRADFDMLIGVMSLYESEYGADDFLLGARRVMLGDAVAEAHPIAALDRRPRLAADT